MGRHVICWTHELPPGERRIVEVEQRSIGIFNIGGEYFAIRNRCPHQAAPLCLGQVTGTTLPSRPGEHRWAREGEIIRCPWHGWEFDIKTGKSVYDPFRCRVRSYEVRVEEADDDEWLEVESYPVKVERGKVVLYV